MILIVAIPLSLIALVVGLIMFATPLEAVALTGFLTMTQAIRLLVFYPRSSSRLLAAGMVLTATAAVVNVAARSRHWPHALVLAGYGVLALALACLCVSLGADVRSGRLSESLPDCLTRFAQARTK